MEAVVYILVMAVVTYLTRMLPTVLFRKKITSRFFLKFLAYLPYAVLAALTFPSIFYSTGSVGAAAVGCGVAFLLAFLRMPLVLVAVAAAVSSFLASFIL